MVLENEAIPASSTQAKLPFLTNSGIRFNVLFCCGCNVYHILEMGIINSMGESIRCGESKTNGVRFGHGHVVRSLHIAQHNSENKVLNKMFVYFRT